MNEYQSWLSDGRNKDLVPEPLFQALPASSVGMDDLELFPRLSSLQPVVHFVLDDGVQELFVLLFGVRQPVVLGFERLGRQSIAGFFKVRNFFLLLLIGNSGQIGPL